MIWIFVWSYIQIRKVIPDAKEMHLIWLDMPPVSNSYQTNLGGPILYLFSFVFMLKFLVLVWIEISIGLNLDLNICSKLYIFKLEILDLMQSKCILAHWSCQWSQFFTKQIQEMQIYIRQGKSSAVGICKSIFFGGLLLLKEVKIEINFNSPSWWTSETV